MQLLIRLLRHLPGLLISPVLIAVPGLALGLTSILFRFFGRSQQPENTRPSTRSASFVIPNWNGRDLLEKYLPSVLAAAGYDENNEVIVTNVRHFEALSKSHEAILRATEGLNNQIASDLIAQDIREAMHYLGEITGEITTDEILGNIFKNFCIGK